MWKTYQALQTALSRKLKQLSNACIVKNEGSISFPPFTFRFLRELFEKDFAWFNRQIYDSEKNALMDMEKKENAGEYTVLSKLVKDAGEQSFNIPAFSELLMYYQAETLEERRHEPYKADVHELVDSDKALKAKLKDIIIGQNMAVDKFVDGFIRYRLRGRRPGKPAGIYLFAGPPGTGKTYLAETFVGLKDMRDAGYQYRRFDMSAYGGASGDTVSGLVGFEKTWRAAQPGQLTDFVRRNPKCILLFDEIEKASQAVRLLFLSVLEGAVLTDKFYDESVSFEEAILIFTTNEGKELYEENRGTNLTALPDSAVIEGLRASQFAPELLSRFMSGTVIMFNHLDYDNMAMIFRKSVKESVGQICNSALDSDFRYDRDFYYVDELAITKLYLLGKGGNLDARFVSSDARKLTEDHFLRAAREIGERNLGSLGHLKKVVVSAEINDTVQGYFGWKEDEKPRILGCLRGGCPADGEAEGLQQVAECIWADGCPEGKQSRFEDLLQTCNWSSRNREDRYDAILIELAGNPEGKPGSCTGREGYTCLKAAVDAKPGIPVILVDKGLAPEDKAFLTALGVTDFVDGVTTPDGLKAIERILDRQHLRKKAAELARKNQKISADAAYSYEDESGELKILFANLRVEAATAEDAETRRQNRKYLLAEKPQVRLTDIFGNALVKKAVERCIDNIKNPEKYRNAGAKLMTGILMYGAPGMGKTMFAKAMAFESGAAFISTVGSDFLNGDGVVKMEEMFQTARRKSPCILFIDEFDAISKHRGGRITSEQENVLEKFLKEMDGLETDNDGVYVVAATNYSLEGLDDAAVRRFSARIPFPYPNMEERLRFLLHVLERKNLKDKVSERAVRTLSIKMYGTLKNYSEIETFIEESIAEAVYKNESVTERFLLNRIHNETDGAARQKGDPKKYIATAFHEAGHAVLQYHYGMGIDYVTIVSRGIYGGYSMGQSRYHADQDLLDQICICFAGRIAEMLYTGKEMGINIGAGSDLQKATYIAYEYVCRYAMDKRIMVVPEMFASQTGGYPEDVLPESEKETIWTSVNQILNQQWNVAIQHLQKCWGEVEALAYSLIYMQELVGEKAEEVIRGKVPYVEEICFLDSDNDYMRTVMVDTETMVPFGYAVYPYYPYSQIKTQPEEADMSETDDRHYFYAVKKAEKPLGISENLQEAFTAAYEQSANCRRFVSLEAAKRYLDMLEMKVFRQGENRFCGFYADALSEMIDSRAAAKDLIILKEGEIGWYQVKTDKAGVTHLTVLKREYTDWHLEKAAEEGMPFPLYLIEEMAEKFLEEHENAYRVIQIYDKALQEELLHYMGAMEYQAKRYRRNLGYKD